MRYAKIKDNAVEQYPISGTDIVLAYPQTSFPAGELTPEIMLSYSCYPVAETEPPAYDEAVFRMDEVTPILIGEQWTQMWRTTAWTEEELAQQQAQKAEQQASQRANAYRNESDPIFFQYQRGEATQQQWLDKVAEIKARYPD